MSESRSKDILARDAGEDDWQPIETAPKDGTRILLYRSGRAVCGNWDEDKYSRKPRPYWSHDLQHVFTLKDARANQPTHWMKLREPPEVNK